MSEQDRDSTREQRPTTPDVRADLDGLDEGDAGDECIDAGAEAADDRVAEMLAEDDYTPEELASAVEEQDAPDAADTLEDLEPEESLAVVKEMEEESAAEALAHMDHALAATVLMDLGEGEAAELLGLMEPDDAADLLQALTADKRSATLLAMPSRQAALLGKLAEYPAESAGGLMTTEVVSLPESLTASEATERLRTDPVFTREGVSGLYVYVTDQDGRLSGVLELRRLLMSPAGSRLSEIMIGDVDAIPPDMDQEEVAHEFERYDYIALPVVDREHRLLGVVTIDDVVDIIQAEQTEDIHKIVGAGARESVSSSVGDKLRGRLPWLAVNLVTSQVAAVVVFGFRDLIYQLTVLAALMPVIANQAGNAGQQSLAVTLRGMVLGEVRGKQAATIVARELVVGLLTGLCVGALLAIGAWLIGAAGWVEGLDWRLGIVGGVAMTGALSMGCLVGAGLPLLMERLGRDPATASSIFLTMVTDSTSFATFLGIAWLLRAWLLPVGAGGV